MAHTDLPYSRPSPCTVEIPFVCDANSVHETSNDQYHYGRTVGKFIEYVGGYIDKSLVRNAKRLGYGPRMTTQRIRGRLDLIEHSFEHYENPGLQYCWSCRQQHRFLHSLALIKEEIDKFVKDARRLLNYVRCVAQKPLNNTALIFSQFERARYPKTGNRFHSWPVCRALQGSSTHETMGSNRSHRGSNAHIFKLSHRQRLHGQPALEQLAQGTCIPPRFTA